MSAAPRSPHEFFQSYLPAWFARAGSSTSSPGSLLFHVGTDTFALRLTAGALEVTLGGTVDAILQLSLAPADFEELITQAAPLLESGATDRLLALRALGVDADRAKLLRNVDGSVSFEIDDSGELRTLLLSPGATLAGSSPPACTVRVAAADFWALSRGERNPFELLMDGKLRVQGRMEVAMALSSVLLG